MADPNGPFEYRVQDGDNDILRKILNWFAALGAGTKSIAVDFSPSAELAVHGVDGGFPVAVTPAPTADDLGFSTYRNTALSATKSAVKAGSGNIYSVNFINTNTSAAYVKFYDALVGNVTVGTTVPVLTVAVPAGSASTPGIVIGEYIKYFATGITIAATVEISDAGTTAPTAGLNATISYK